MGKHIGTGGLAQGKILGQLAFYTWVHTEGGGGDCWDEHAPL